MTHGKERKERVLHTRVSEQLDEELRSKAAGLGVSVSNLVRNILINTVEMVEDIVMDSSAIMGRNSNFPASSSATPSQSGNPTILGWQTLTLSVNAVCQVCNEILPKASQAAVAVTSPPSTQPAFRCITCTGDEVQNTKDS